MHYVNYSKKPSQQPMKYEPNSVRAIAASVFRSFYQSRLFDLLILAGSVAMLFLIALNYFA